MKRIIAISSIFLLLLSIGCSSKSAKEMPKEKIDIIRQQGIDDARKVINSRHESMEQEKALLSIRATEAKILASGDTAAARAYIDAAESELKDSGLIRNN